MRSNSHQVKGVGALVVMAILAVAFWLNFVRVLNYEVGKALRVPFDTVPTEGAVSCPESYDSDWLNIMKYTQCKGINFEGRATVMKEPSR